MHISVMSEKGERLEEIEEGVNNLLKLYYNYARETQEGLGWRITHQETKVLQALKSYANREARKAFPV